ncbi:50S ribosomal protein L23 [Desulfurispirillum indicum]|uniref:Large ribosomal subunit protein uL23 n=1 Tax=Desulfurispirillum indicum (strain ATCC BAA-1389 / DSM 22839 / S5) TaxID=653733 RepID=E6W712_DESIS|nr:50S ribosomal protein L23 [Desulfurispirillum indicum]ADU65090.1 Ribosomal protein L25/L23 [Desulfurispirillum indicum S5]UCZ56995.1 50S ribosomal protein L23 [Desulfurispirillum indicum]
MQMYDIIKRPIMTERSFVLNEQRNQVAFEVDTRANKIEIKNAVEKIFDVKVANVNVMNMNGKVKRTRMGMGKRKDWKKAIVTLEAGSQIKIFEE